MPTYTADIIEHAKELYLALSENMDRLHSDSEISRRINKIVLESTSKAGTTNNNTIAKWAKKGCWKEALEDRKKEVLRAVRDKQDRDRSKAVGNSAESVNEGMRKAKEQQDKTHKLIMGALDLIEELSVKTPAEAIKYIKEVASINRSSSERVSEYDKLAVEAGIGRDNDLNVTINVLKLEEDNGSTT